MPTIPMVTIERFIIQQERLHPGATGELSDLLYDIALAAKVISGYVRRAGLLDVLGRAGGRNVQGEEPQKLDVLANEVIKNAVGGSGRVCILASEEEGEPIVPPPDVGSGKYVLLFDPLDGSSNIDVSVSIGTIFSIYRRISPGGPGTMQDLLRRGRDQVAAGYVIYGSSTVLVYSSGQGVHGFVLDPSIGEFLLWNAEIEMPAVGRYYSVNESHWSLWSAGYRQAVSILKGLDGKGNGKNSRYIGSLVADFHRNLLAGGIFLYPGDRTASQGKLRLLYEAAPLAMIAEQAGGAASDGFRRILDIQSEALHQRTPLVIGSREDVALVHRVLEEEVEKAEQS